MDTVRIRLQNQDRSQTKHVLLLLEFDSNPEFTMHSQTKHVLLLLEFDSSQNSPCTHSQTKHVLLLQFYLNQEFTRHSQTKHVLLLLESDSNQEFTTLSHANQRCAPVVRSRLKPRIPQAQSNPNHVLLLLEFV